MSVDDDLSTLARITGLDLPNGEMARLAALYERFSADRARLAATSAGEAEPAITFRATRTDDPS